MYVCAPLNLKNVLGYSVCVRACVCVCLSLPTLYVLLNTLRLEYVVGIKAANVSKQPSCYLCETGAQAKYVNMYTRMHVCTYADLGAMRSATSSEDVCM